MFLLCTSIFYILPFLYLCFYFVLLYFIFYLFYICVFTLYFYILYFTFFISVFLLCTSIFYILPFLYLCFYFVLLYFIFYLFYICVFTLYLHILYLYICYVAIGEDWCMLFCDTVNISKNCIFIFFGLYLFLTFSNASFLADIFGSNGWICVNFWSDISLRSTHIFQEFGIFSNVNDGKISTFQCIFLLKTPSYFYRHSNNYWRSKCWFIIVSHYWHSPFTGAHNTIPEC